MALYLDEQTRPYLERKFKQVDEKDFIGKRIQGMLKADSDRLDKIGDCQHVAGEYIGKKDCCVKCEAYFKPGQGERWTTVSMAG